MKWNCRVEHCAYIQKCKECGYEREVNKMPKFRGHINVDMGKGDSRYHTMINVRDNTFGGY